MEYTISLAGNPNVGKTSLYNRITHSLEHVGNWHGVTVSEVSKQIMYDHHKINMVDLPGLYSLTIYSMEEGITRDNVLSGKNDLIVSVCEVNNLSRNLYLTLQLLELNVPLVLVVNMMDELKKQGKVLNYRKIETFLKIPIIPMSAKYHSDVHLLMDVAIDYIQHFRGNTVQLTYLEKLPLKDVMSVIGANASAAGFQPKWAAIKALEKDSFVLEKLRLSEDQAKALEAFGDWQSRVAQARYEFIDMITEGAVSKAVSDEHHEMHEHVRHSVPLETEKTDGESLPSDDRHFRHHDYHKNNSKLYMQAYSRIDKFVLNKYLALPIFLLLMCAVFFVTFGLLGNWLSELLDWLFTAFVYAPVTKGLTNIGSPVWIVDLVGEGVILGVLGVLKFLPQVVLLFFFLALMEDSGYISRVAFMTDGLFRKIGLSGRSVFTMLMGFGCSATAVLTARGLEDDTMRKKTVILTPFMSCSARLPVYSVVAGAFFASGKFLIIFGLYILGAAVSLAAAAIFEKAVKPLKSGKLSFIMEMPPYRVPTFERVMQIILHNAKVFIVKVGTVVFALNVIVWILSNFSFTSGYTAGGENSILAAFSGFIAPVFLPLGFGNWRAVTSLMSGLVAKEVVVSSIESLGGVESVFIGPHASLSALTFLVYTLLYVPCIATLSAELKEVGWKWTLFGLLLQLGVAYAVALVFHSVGLAFILNPGVAAGVTIVAVIALAVAGVIVYKVKNRGKCCCGCGSSCSGCVKSRGGSKASKDKANDSDKKQKTNL
ncbi:MAG: ferrous iron transport protein B [Christensenellales bacterium]